MSEKTPQTAADNATSKVNLSEMMSELDVEWQKAKAEVEAAMIDSMLLGPGCLRITQTPDGIVVKEPWWITSQDELDSWE